VAETRQSTETRWTTSSQTGNRARRLHQAGYARSELTSWRAQETLRRGVFGIEVEVELNPMYEQQPLLSDIDRFLRPFGYELASI
jgi:hypothetical protein